MKKLTGIILLLAMVVAMNAQDGDLKKQTYFRFGFSLPSWKYVGNENRDDWGGDFTKRAGGIFEVGNIFILNSIKLSPGMRIGINVDYLSLVYNRFAFDNSLYLKSSNFMFFGSKIGPSFSYSPVQHLTFDAYFKFNPVWAAANYTALIDDTAGDNFYLGFMGIKYSVGLNVRYSLLMVGFEFNPGFAKMKYFDDDAGEFTDVYYSNVNDNGKKTPVPAMNFTVGLSF
jgi:hypothetical protein